VVESDKNRNTNKQNHEGILLDESHKTKVEEILMEELDSSIILKESYWMNKIKT
jgi:hypothetical protein